MMKYSAVGQRERTTVVTRSQIDKIYTDGFKDGVREMQEKFSMILALGEEVDTDRAVDFLAEIAKELLEEAK